jgi:RNA polymerase sigma factor (sigma-70 family)
MPQLSPVEILPLVLALRERGPKWAKNPQGNFLGPFQTVLSQCPVEARRRLLFPVKWANSLLSPCRQEIVMPQPPAVGTDTQLQNLIDQGLNGDAAAHDALLNHACDRLLRLTRKMFHGYPDLRRWEQTDDVFQNSMVRLHRAMAEVPVESVRHFFNLAAVQIRRELLDLAKHHFGPEGGGANHHTDGHPADNEGGPLHENAEEPDDLAGWSEFHTQVEKLSEDEREVVNLIYYEGLTQEEAAKVLGISFRTLKRRWQAAKVNLYEALKSDRQG